MCQSWQCKGFCMRDYWGKTKTVKFDGDIPEHARVLVELGEPKGDSTRTSIRFEFDAGASPEIEIQRADYDPTTITAFRVMLVGQWEREGFALAMRAAADELLTE